MTKLWFTPRNFLQDWSWPLLHGEHILPNYSATRLPRTTPQLPSGNYPTHPLRVLWIELLVSAHSTSHSPGHSSGRGRDRAICWGKFSPLSMSTVAGLQPHQALNRLFPSRLLIASFAFPWAYPFLLPRLLFPHLCFSSNYFSSSRLTSVSSLSNLT
jgi:hypothetical protein